ncbi:hypothetical protein M9H77_28532 [Catharanthus roseus]|uniref:Uncharacterized protein n=1 Tax=Catharanthus roseus TaxID=4058 RepID=A0ACC0AFZ8_CATRO|nr:hypothetical protein M9H77_28532 [Catharanthus roseus]
MSEQQARRYRVGYALAPKKVQSFIQDSLLNHAKDRGIDLIPVQLTKPLIEQGPFDCIIHKLSGQEWKQQLDDYSLRNPNVPIIDPLEPIDRLHNRISMLQVVNQLNLCQQAESFGIPDQIFVQDFKTLNDPTVLQDLKFPVIAKPLVADGSANSHQMSLVFNKEGLKGLNPPVVLQEFVNHGGVIFKVYVAGDHVTCVKRKSLRDISEEKLGISQNLLSFSQISNLITKDRNDDPSWKLIEEAQLPPVTFINELASALGKALKLHLFNFDVIRDSRIGNRYLIIDINYFPGYAKMPSYETVFTDFLIDIVCRRRSEMETAEMKEEAEGIAS